MIHLQPHSLRELVLGVVSSYHGTFYKWGGDDPSGFDCSGLIVEGLKATGIFPRSFDTTAQGLFDRFEATSDPVPGDLVFWKRGEKIVHVEMIYCLIDGNLYTIGASGGGSRTLTHEDAIAENAYIKIRPMKRDRTLAGFRDPFAGGAPYA